jgi:hypothetical protein
MPQKGKHTTTGIFGHPAKKPGSVVMSLTQHPGLKQLMGKFYSWVDTTNHQPTPGAEAFAFNSEMLPLQDWKGNGEIVRRQLYLTAPQVYQMQNVIPTGLAGIAAGQIYLAGLMDNPYDPDSLNYEVT